MSGYFLIEPSRLTHSSEAAHKAVAHIPAAGRIAEGSLLAAGSLVAEGTPVAGDIDRTRRSLDSIPGGGLGTRPGGQSVRGAPTS